MLALYGFDIHEVLKFRAPIRVAFAYLNRLPYEPWSLWRAMQLGGPEHMGWTPDTYRQAELIDAMNINTVITANVGSRKQPDMPEPAYRPSVKQPEEKPAQSLADFNLVGLISQIGG